MPISNIVARNTSSVAVLVKTLKTAMNKFIQHLHINCYTLYIFAFKHVIQLRECIFLLSELGCTFCKWKNCTPKKISLITKNIFYCKKIYCIAILYWNIEYTFVKFKFPIFFSNAYAVGVIVMLCLLQARTVLPNDDKYKCSYVLSFISQMMAHKWPEHVDYNSI